MNVVEDLNQNSCRAVVWLKSWLKDKNPFSDSEGYLVFYFIISFIYHLISSYHVFSLLGWLTGLTTEPQKAEAGPGDEVKMSKETQLKVEALR